VLCRNRETPNAKRRTPNAKRRTPNAERKLQTLCAFLCFLPATLFAEWRVLDRQPSEPADGVPFRLKVTNDATTANLLLIVFHPNRFAIRVVSNEEGRYGSVADAAAAFDAVAGVNGGYFQLDGTPVGLLISDNRTIHQFGTAKLLSGVVFVRDGKPGLVRSSRFARLKDVSEAIQSGPFLVEDGRVLTGLNNGRSAARTFVFAGSNSVWGFGICRSVTLAEMGQILSTPNLLGPTSVISALNLDGGSSTQFWARSGDDVINSSSLALVANYLLLVHRAK
jgi:exopolysaccharide biosynthesis protein